MAASSSLVEVERKFLPTAQLRAYLHGQQDEHSSLKTFKTKLADRSGQMKAMSLSRLPDKLIRDTYFDIGERLAEKGIWIRRRSSQIRHTVDPPPVPTGTVSTKWEAKIRLAGNFVNSQFHEIEGQDNVRAVVNQHLADKSLEELEEFADLETHRKTWIIHQPREWKQVLVDGGTCELRIVLDDVTTPVSSSESKEVFRHAVGEVEMTTDIQGTTNGEDHDQIRREVAQRMDKAIGEFMEHYAVLQPTEPKPLGKLSAYFAWKKR